MAYSTARLRDSISVGALRLGVEQRTTGASSVRVGPRVTWSSPTDRLVIPFGVPAIDHVLQGGGLIARNVHEVSGVGFATEHAAGATLFVAGIAARAMVAFRRWGIWISGDPPYLPALIGCGVDPDRLLFASPRSRAGVLQTMEDALRSDCMAVVVGEPGPELSHVESRRLQLAAEVSGAVGLVLRRSRVFEDSRLRQPSASVTRWRIAAAPSALAYPGRPRLRGLGPARWGVDLVKNRGGDIGSWLVQACDAQGRLRLAADAADRSVATEWSTSDPVRSAARIAA